MSQSHGPKYRNIIFIFKFKCNKKQVNNKNVLKYKFKYNEIIIIQVFIENKWYGTSFKDINYLRGTSTSLAKVN